MSASQRISELERHYAESLNRLGGSPSLGNDLRTADESVFEDSLDQAGFARALGGRPRARQTSPTYRGARGGASSSPPSRKSVSPSQKDRDRGIAAQLGKMSEDEKDATIKHLKEEIERLKGKVNTIVHSAETSLEEAIESQESMRKQMNSRVSQEQKKYQHLVAENAALKEVIMSLNEELINERAHVEKAMRFMERMKSNPAVQADKNKVFSLTGSFSHSQKLQHT